LGRRTKNAIVYLCWIDPGSLDGRTNHVTAHGRCLGIIETTTE
jgi:hypothetical protein